MREVVEELARVLDELIALDLGMVNGAVVPVAERDRRIHALSERARAGFERLRTQPERARLWLAELPMVSRPRCFDLAPWHAELGVPIDEYERLRWRRERKVGLHAGLLVPIGGDGPITLERVDAVFRTSLPAALRDHAFPGRTMAGLVAIAGSVSDEQLGYHSVAPAPPDAPFAVLPLARVGEADHVALELATGRVVTCRHDIDELGRVWPSIDAWITTRSRAKPRRRSP